MNGPESRTVPLRLSPPIVDLMHVRSVGPRFLHRELEIPFAVVGAIEPLEQLTGEMQIRSFGRCRRCFARNRARRDVDLEVVRDVVVFPPLIGQLREPIDRELG